MNLICPHCQRMLSVPDQNAGQTTTCPFCSQTFQVPALPPTTIPDLADLPLDIPLVPEPPSPEPTPPVSSTSPLAREEEVYRVAPEPPKPAPAPPPPRREERVRVAPSLQPPLRPAGKPPPSPPPTGYVHTRTLLISSRVVPWVALVAFALLFLLLFFSWTGAYPGGYGVYTQSAFQAIFGSHSTDPVGERVLNKESVIEEHIRANWLRMGLYFLLVLAALILAAAPKVIASASLKLPPALQPYWPWRSALLAAAAVLAFLLLLIQLAAGFGLERALAEPVEAGLEKKRAEASTAEEKEKVDIEEGMALGQFNLHRTGWLRLAGLLNLVGIVCVLLEIWLDKRGSRPMPRMDIQW